MRRHLKVKLIFSFLGVALTTVLVVSAVIWLTSGQSLMDLVMEQQTALLNDSAQAYYTANGAMDGFFSYYSQIKPLQPNPGQSGPPNNGPQTREFRGVSGLVDTEYQALIPTFGYEVGQTVPANMIKRTVPVVVNGQTVAWIIPDTKSQFKLSPEEQQFLKRTTLAIGLAALAGVSAAVAMGFFLSGRLLKPIQRLTKASKALALGDLDQQVPVTSRDELGQLTTTFNQMSADLVKADQQRKRITADITLDLSTPIQIVSGYMEMLENGEVDLNAQRIDIIKTEMGHLKRLVSDLSTLTQAEAGGLDIQLLPVQPAVLLERIYHAYLPIAARQGVELSLDAPAFSPAILVDEGRMLQVLKNLVENALRYTHEGGKIRLSAKVGDHIQLMVEDNGSGIDPEDLPLVFDRFFRSDKVRGANAGKMGLGLAICKALVTAQDGTIKAESAGKDQGTAMLISFDPLPSKSGVGKFISPE
jgi:signal transduction histidine kinase